MTEFLKQYKALIRTLTLNWRRCCRWTRPVFVCINTPLARCAVRTQGADSNYTKLENEPADHAIGRSRGGLTTKIHALTDALVRPVTLLLTAGQSGDNPQLGPLLDLHQVQGHNNRDFILLADKAYSHPSTRAGLRERHMKHVIPERSDQIQNRKNKGQKGGRPPKFDAELYKQRNTVERGFSRFKQWRAIATRYDKYALTFRGGALLAATILHSAPN